MKFGLISLDFRRFPLEKCFEVAKRYEFQGVELWGGRPHAYPYDIGTHEIETILHYKDKYQLEIPMYTPNAIGLPVNLCSSMAKERSEGLNYYKRAIDVAASLEIPKMLVVADHPGFGIDRKEAWKYFSEAISQLASYSENRNVILSIEPLTPMESPVITSTDDCLNLARQINSSNLHFVLDIVPPTIIQEPISNYFIKLGNRVDHVHISNSDKKTDAHLELDNGLLNIQDILQILQDYEYDQFVIIELYSVSLNDPERVVASSARVLAPIRQLR